jgi:hypothetical protein
MDFIEFTIKVWAAIFFGTCCMFVGAMLVCQAAEWVRSIYRQIDERGDK